LSEERKRKGNESERQLIKQHRVWWRGGHPDGKRNEREITHCRKEEEKGKDASVCTWKSERGRERERERVNATRQERKRRKRSFSEFLPRARAATSNLTRAPPYRSSDRRVHAIHSLSFCPSLSIIQIDIFLSSFRFPRFLNATRLQVINSTISAAIQRARARARLLKIEYLRVAVLSILKSLE